MSIDQMIDCEIKYLMKSISKLGSIVFFFLVCFSGGLSNFLYYVSLPDDIDSCNSVKTTKRARKDASLQEPKEVRINLFFVFLPRFHNQICK